jgi:hypothetical protein
MSLTRYDCDTSDCEGDNSNGNCQAKMIESRNGEYVLYDDVRALLVDLRSDFLATLANYMSS